MASRIFFTIRETHPLCEERISIRESWDDMKTNLDDAQWSSVIIAKGNIIEGLKAKE